MIEFGHDYSHLAETPTKHNEKGLNVFKVLVGCRSKYINHGDEIRKKMKQVKTEKTSLSETKFLF